MATADTNHFPTYDAALAAAIHYHGGAWYLNFTITLAVSDHWEVWAVKDWHYQPASEQQPPRK